MSTRHPDYERWVKAWGERAADDENNAWLQSGLADDAEEGARIEEHLQRWRIEEMDEGPKGAG